MYQLAGFKDFAEVIVANNDDSVKVRPSCNSCFLGLADSIFRSYGR